MRHSFFPEQTVRFLQEELEVMESKQVIGLLYLSYRNRAREMIKEGETVLAAGYTRLAKIARVKYKEV